MNKKIMNYKNIVIAILFIIIELTLGILVQTTSGVSNTTSSFLVVIISFIFSIIMLTKSKFSILLCIGLLFTIFADLFLVVLNPMKQIPAMFCFSVTQICYFMIIYFKQESKKAKSIHIITRIIITTISLITTKIVLKDNTDLLSLVSLFYYANLLVNIIFSFNTSNLSVLFKIGLILFACCDLLIGLNIMGGSYLPIKEGTFLYFLAHPGFNLAWIFYVPSQALLSLTSYQFKNFSY